MSRGRKPTPTALKVLRGNPGKRRLPVGEPQPTLGVPDCPEHLDVLARQQWFRWCDELAKMRVLTHADREVLAVMCDTWSRYVQAQRVIQKTGLLVKAPSGYPILNPALSVANKCAGQLRAYAAEFGLTPASRAHLSVSTTPAGNEFAEA